MHTRYIYGPNIPIKDANAHNLHMHTRYISFFELSSSVLFRRSQPTYAYKIYLWFQSEPLIRIDLTTYICIQDISSVVQPENQCKVSQPTYAYKIYHLHGRRAIYPRDSQPTYAYKIYLPRHVQPSHLSHSQPTYAYKIYPIAWGYKGKAKAHNLHMHTRYI